ncbi:MAG TPA: hypothetical protein VGJ21_09700 [Terracidiphilus sp.]|jgi:hypothetical protein
MTERTANSEPSSESIEQLLRAAVPPIGEDAEPRCDLWPAMQQRLERKVDLRSVPWFDWALGAGVALVAVAVPATAPVLLYYL